MLGSLVESRGVGTDFVFHEDRPYARLNGIGVGQSDDVGGHAPRNALTLRRLLDTRDGEGLDE